MLSPEREVVGPTWQKRSHSKCIRLFDQAIAFLVTQGGRRMGAECKSDLVMLGLPNLCSVFSVEWLSDPSGADLTVAFFLLLLLLHPVSRSSIKSHISAIWALPLTYYTSSEWGEHQGSSGGDQDDDKDTQKDKYKDKDDDRSFNKKASSFNMCCYTYI